MDLFTALFSREKIRKNFHRPAPKKPGGTGVSPVTTDTRAPPAPHKTRHPPPATRHSASSRFALAQTQVKRHNLASPRTRPRAPTKPAVSVYTQNEKVEPIDVAEEMSRSFLDYSMSVIISRALPDARDGLKPAQRRILYAMHDLRLFPGRQHIKCAKICGDTSGNYHPHGEAVIYPTLVHMAQN